MCESSECINEYINEPKHYTTKSDRDLFFNWFLNTYPLVGYLNGHVTLPNCEYLRNQYRTAAGTTPSIGNTRQIIKFYKMFKYLIKDVQKSNQDQQ